MSNRQPFVFYTIVRLLEDVLALVRLGLTSRAHLAAENLFLRKQLALYQERTVSGLTITMATRHPNQTRDIQTHSMRSVCVSSSRGRDRFTTQS